jgi:hypothetical protein
LILLFEPWNLGDAIIAASFARLAPDRFVLACNSRWHEVLTLASSGSLNLLPLDLPYVWRTGKKYFSLGDAAASAAEFKSNTHQKIEVISIRGDIRDCIAAHRLFPRADFKFTGLLYFCARKTAMLDFPFKHGYLRVRNRYRAWAEAVGIPFNEIECAYSPTERRGDAPVLIHVGAQWRSKQYPHVSQLAELLRKRGLRVEILAGPNDPLPEGITADMVQRPKWPELVAYFRTARHVISNDSGPMHLAAYLGCQTLALSRCSNIQEWLPPGATALSSPSAPHGYRPTPEYWSDQVLPDWPLPNEVMAVIESEVEGMVLTNNEANKGFQKP